LIETIELIKKTPKPLTTEGGESESLEEEKGGQSDSYGPFAG